MDTPERRASEFPLSIISSSAAGEHPARCSFSPPAVLDLFFPADFRLSSPSDLSSPCWSDSRPDFSGCRVWILEISGDGFLDWLAGAKHK